MKDVMKWLLEEDNPSLRYRTLTQLLDRSKDDEEVRKIKEAIPGSPAVKHIFDGMHRGGYWLQTNPRSGEVTGEGVEYGAFATTHFCLAYLSELAMDKSNRNIARASRRYLGLQKSDGDWWNHYSCLIAYNIRTFVRLGYRDNEHVQRAIDYLLQYDRWDGGYLCDMHEGKKKKKKSCVRGAGKALLAFSELPEYWKHKRVKELVDYFLKRGGIFTSKYGENGMASEYVNKDIGRAIFPIIWRTNLFEILLALGKMGYGQDERLEDAWRLLKSRESDTGRYILDWTPTQSPWKVGKRGKENKWITFYSLLALKYKEYRPG